MAQKRDYAIEYARRKARAQAEGYRSYGEKRRAAEHQQSPSYVHLSKKEENTWLRAFRALTQMEKGVSLSRAARQAHTTPGVVRKYMGQDIQRRGRRWVPSDQYIKSRALKVRIMTEDGFMVVPISDAATRSEYATYLSYVGMYFNKDPDIRKKGINGLTEFQGRTFKDTNGVEHPYITDRRLLIELYEDGKLDLEGFYEQMAR
jgi:hypothetical protein